MGLLVWTRGRDEQYAGLTPGLSPGLGQEHQVVRGGPAPTVAVQFTPPAGVQPGLVGTIIDEEAGLTDVTATIIDLAVRGHLRISRDDDRSLPTRRLGPHPDHAGGREPPRSPPTSSCSTTRSSPAATPSPCRR